MPGKRAAAHCNQQNPKTVFCQRSEMNTDTTKRFLLRRSGEEAFKIHVRAYFIALRLLFQTTPNAWINIHLSVRIFSSGIFVQLFRYENENKRHNFHDVRTY